MVNNEFTSVTTDEVRSHLHELLSTIQLSQYRHLLVTDLQLSQLLAMLNAAGIDLSDQEIWLASHESNTGPVPLNQFSQNDYQLFLGQECQHLIFNATESLSANALAGLSGTIKAGGLLILITPEWSHWAEKPSSEHAKLFGTQLSGSSEFINHLQSIIKNAEGVTQLFIDNSAVDDQVELFKIVTRNEIQSDSESPFEVQSAVGSLTAEQLSVVEKIKRVFLGHGRRPLVLTADRGRGKSSCLGVALAELEQVTEHRFWVVAPSRNTLVACQHWYTAAGGQQELMYKSPTQVLELLSLPNENQNRECLPFGIIVDEAAAIPVRILSLLLQHFPRSVFTTTTHGYEGNGRGFAIRFTQFLNQLTPKWRHAELQQPIRWRANDPVERIINQLFLFDNVWSHKQLSAKPETDRLIVNELNNKLSKKFNKKPLSIDWAFYAPGELLPPDELKQAFSILVTAHYQTTPDDLRQFIDAPTRFVLLAKINLRVVGVCWASAEGELDAELAQQVQQGERRIKGNLVAQSLAFHANKPELAMCLSWRIQRIAVDAEWRRKGVGTELIKTISQRATEFGVSFISSSFAATDEVCRFWLSEGFVAVRLGASVDSSSGCYSAMVAKPLIETIRQALDELSMNNAFNVRMLWSSLFPLIETSVVLQFQSPNAPVSKLDHHHCQAFTKNYQPAVEQYPFIHQWLMNYATIYPTLPARIQQALDQLAEIVWRDRLAGHSAKTLKQLMADIMQEVSLEDTRRENSDT